jgi:thymidylate synthase (FAD)
MKTAEIDVTLIDHMGSDLSVVNAARVSFAKESELEWSNEIHDYLLSHADTKLIDYLATHNHWSPFAHAFATFRIKAPIFVARQLVKHQVGLAWNEVSRRYVDDEPEFFFPETWRGRPEGSIKQGSAGVITSITSDESVDVDPTGVMENAARAALNAYTWALEGSIAPEQARMILPQNMMTEWIWSGSLMAFARVCNLRLDPHAQQETSEVAAQIAVEMAELFPISWKELTK